VERLNKERQTTKRPIDDADFIVAALWAGTQAIESWASHRDRQRARIALSGALESAATSATIRREAESLASAVPPGVLDAMTQRVQQCWQRLEHAMRSDDDLPPGEIDVAIIHVRGCICGELRRILQLNGALPEGPMRIWWERFCGTG
jgi:hypothetical protein